MSSFRLSDKDEAIDRGLQYWQQFGQFQRETTMGRYAKDSGGGDFQQAPAGNHVARCIRVIDLGTQHGEYQGKPNAMQKIVLTWELPDEHMDDGQPFIVSAFYTNSLSEKAHLRAVLESWFNKQMSPEVLAKGFDLTNVLGKACMLSVIHNDKDKARVASVATLPKGVKAPNGINEQFAYWIEEHDPVTYEKIGEGLRKMIEVSDEWVALRTARSAQPANAMASIMDMDQDVPFANPYSHGVWRVV